MLYKQVSNPCLAVIHPKQRGKMFSGSSIMKKWGLISINLGLLYFLTGSLTYCSQLDQNFFKRNKTVSDSSPMLQRFDITLPATEIHEDCFSLFPGQTLSYSFQASAPMDFDVHYHESDTVVYPISRTNISSDKASLPIEKPQIYCLMWANSQNQSIRVQYERTISYSKPSQKISVKFKVDGSLQAIHIVNSENSPLAQFDVNSTIHNFALNHKGSDLAVLTSLETQALQIYDVSSQRLKASQTFRPIPRFLNFSQNDRYLVLADEHSQKIILLDADQLKTLGTLPVSDKVIALDTSGESNQFLVRTETEVLKFQFEPFQLLERNAKVPVKFGNTTIMLSSEELCTIHGVPHPLFTPTIDAMGAEGWPARLPSDFTKVK